MDKLLELARRLWFLLNRSRLERELEEEMAEHRRQMGDPRAFGHSLHRREEARDAWGWRWLDQAWLDARFAARVLRKSPVFASSAVTILATGIGVNLALFQIIDAVLLRPPAIRDPGSLARLYRKGVSHTSSSVPYPMARFLRANNSAISGVITTLTVPSAWNGDAGDQIDAQFVSPNIFDELGYGPAAGRVLHEDPDERPGAPPAVVLSHALWTRRFGADPAVIGSTVRINNGTATVVGIAAANYPGLRFSRADVWIPIEQLPWFVHGAKIDAWDTSRVELYARLRPGVTVGAARESMRATVSALAAARPRDVKKDEWLEPYSGDRHFQTDQEFFSVRAIAALGMALALLILGVGCSNLANLVLARASARVHETSIRASLGAGREQLIRQQLVESAMLVAAGTILGFALERALLALTIRGLGVPVGLDLNPDWRTALAASGFAIFATALAGLVPAISSTRGSFGLHLRVSDSGGPRGSRTRRWLLGAQVAGSCLLLFVAGMFVRGIQEVLTSGLGFEYGNIAVLDPNLYRYGIEGEAARGYWTRVRELAQRNAEVDQVTVVSSAPLGSSLNEGTYDRDAPGLYVTSVAVEPGFFRMMEIPLLRGRDFEPSDDHRATAIIGRRVAERMYGTIDVLGKSFPRTKGERTIIGVAADARLIKVMAANTSELYTPLDPAAHGGYKLLVKARTSPERILQSLRQAAQSADSRVLASALPMSAGFERRTQPYRFLAAALSFAGLAALILAAMGVFGIVSCGVTQRTREIGIRRALGAEPLSILGVLFSELRVSLLAGVLIGLLTALAAGFALRGDPFHLRPSDPLAFTGSAILLLAAGLAAVALPARRAVTLDPARAIRFD